MADIVVWAELGRQAVPRIGVSKHGGVHEVVGHLPLQNRGNFSGSALFEFQDSFLREECYMRSDKHIVQLQQPVVRRRMGVHQHIQPSAADAAGLKGGV